MRTQARAIWPQEVPAASSLSASRRAPRTRRRLRHRRKRPHESPNFPPPPTYLASGRIIDDHLKLARERYASLAPRLTFAHQSVYALDAPDDSFDLTLCRHVLHSIPHAAQVMSELARVTRPGGYLHIIPEDYGMLHFQCAALDPRDFWNAAPAAFGAATGTDLFIGRNAFSILAAAGLEKITVDYIVVDTVRVPRETFAAIIEAWRDGYAESIAQFTPITRESAIAYFDQMIANIRDPRGYAVSRMISGRECPEVPAARQRNNNNSQLR